MTKAWSMAFGTPDDREAEALARAVVDIDSGLSRPGLAGVAMALRTLHADGYWPQEEAPRFPSEKKGPCDHWRPDPLIAVWEAELVPGDLLASTSVCIARERATIDLNQFRFQGVKTVSDVDLKALTAEIVSAYVGSNQVSARDLPGIITSIHATLASVDQAPAPAEVLTPAVAIKKSVTPEAIICLECGRKLKMLKRHLSTDHDLTIDAYRAKWGLTADYPVVAPNYAAHRSQLAKDIGLGRKKAAE